MTTVTLLNEADLRASVTLDLDAVDCVEQAFRDLAFKAVAMPPVLRLDLPEHNGEMDVKTAYIPGLDSFALKVSPGFFDNPKRGLPSLNGMMMLLSSQTGLLQALLLDNGYLTAVRTAAAGAVSARWLARADARHAAIIGAGQQARLQLRALRLVRPIEVVKVWAPRLEQAQRFASEMSSELDLAVTPCADIDSAVRGADVVVTTTPSRTPLIELHHLRPGMHITAMGADAEHKNEIAPAALAAVTRYVADRLTQVRKLGELHHAIEAGRVAADAELPELGQVIAGLAAGRRSPEDVTLCDLTGLGVQDTAIATFAHAQALRAGRGLPLHT